AVTARSGARAGRTPTRGSRPRSGGRPRGGTPGGVAPVTVTLWDHLSALLALRERLPAPRRARAKLRISSALFVVLVLLGVLVVRLTYLQFAHSHDYGLRAEQQRVTTEALFAPRGAITDRTGNPLAYDVPTRTVIGDPSALTHPTMRYSASVPGTPEKAAAALSPLLGLPVDVLTKKLTGANKYVKLATQVPLETATRIGALAVPGISMVDTSQRMYPGKDLAAGALGFVDGADNGVGGIEQQWNKQLQGTPGSLLVEQSSSGAQLPFGVHKQVDAKPGTGLKLTLDRDLQYTAQAELAAEVQAAGARGGAVISMKPTGEILALATAPSMDLTNPGAAPAAARGNSAVSEVYEPGSVNKVITAAAAIETGTATPETQIVVPPSIHVAGQDFVDAEAHGTERLTFTGVLAQSSNIGTIEVAQKLGNQTLYDYLRKFGLGSTTGSGLPGESPGILAPVQKWSGTQAATIPFGQGMAATVLQVAGVYATIANGGVRPVPRLVDATVAPDGTTTPVPGKPGTRVVSAATAKTVSQMLEAVTGGAGTAPAAAIPGYRVAGKTGTAYAVSNGRYDGGYVASFVGFAPADAPALITVVVLDHPTTSHFGGEVAAPVFHAVESFGLKTLAVPPTGATPPPAKLNW
ncbi:MAG: Peptidoglycan glycosyltransferase, partial [Mycobacterium sp.]|nr:Peptidoglycan glycosyltransferase [Mycobacterium sp.]